MSDIVERLRETACWDPERPDLPTGQLAGQLLEAANEIIRLRAELDELRRVVPERVVEFATGMDMDAVRRRYAAVALVVALT